MTVIVVTAAQVQAVRALVRRLPHVRPGVHRIAEAGE